MKQLPRVIYRAVIATSLLRAFVFAQPPAPTTSAAAPASARGARGMNPDAGQAGNTVRSPEVTADHRITVRLQAPNAKSVQVFGDFTKDLAGIDLTKDDNGVWSYTTAELKPSYYQYWFVMDGLTMPDPLNTFVRPASGVYKSQVAVPGKEAEFMTFRDVPHGNLTEHFYLNQENKTARRVVVYTPPDYSTSGKSYPVLYLLHGANDFERGWTQAGMANVIMDNLIADGKAVPAIIVMPFGHDTTGSAGRQPEVKALQKSLGYVEPARVLGADHRLQVEVQEQEPVPRQAVQVADAGRHRPGRVTWKRISSATS